MYLENHRFINSAIDGGVKKQATGAIRKWITAPDLEPQ